jgi:ATPase subunit of ABC transporter with duplicated ATPase domains
MKRSFTASDSANLPEVETLITTLAASDLVKRYGERLALRGVSLTAGRGELVAVIGPNGAGKTTLFKMILGEEQPDSGTIKIGETVKISYVSAFGFKGPDQQKPAGVLSGGERNRLNLALTLKIGGNLLLLDEPTNDLDVETLSSLENALLEFSGCAVVVSHDRWFLDRVATHILAWEGDSKWFWFEGNFEAYERNKVERLGIDATRPHRATYRKLTRE